MGVVLWPRTYPCPQHPEVRIIKRVYPRRLRMYGQKSREKQEKHIIPGATWRRRKWWAASHSGTCSFQASSIYMSRKTLFLSGELGIWGMVLSHGGEKAFEKWWLSSVGKCWEVPEVVSSAAGGGGGWGVEVEPAEKLSPQSWVMLWSMLATGREVSHPGFSDSSRVSRPISLFSCSVERASSPVDQSSQGLHASSSTASYAAGDKKGFKANSSKETREDLWKAVMGGTARSK